MGLFKKNNNKPLFSDLFSLVEAHANLRENIVYTVQCFEEYLVIRPCVGPKNEAILQYSQITDVSVHTETEVIEKKQSAVGRAVVGGLLFGGAGAVVGAVSAGTKQKKNIHARVLISYISQTGETNTITLETGNSLSLITFPKKLRKCCGLAEASTVETATTVSL